MHFHDIVLPAAVATELAANGKKALFQKLSDMAAAAYNLNSGRVFDSLIERERLGSTGFGGGVAIPHAKIEGLEKMCGMVVLLEPAIEFDAVDDAPVDVVFALLSPLDSGAEHLKTLARVSRYLRDEAQITRLRGAGSTEALYALLGGNETRDAA